MAQSKAKTQRIATITIIVFNIVGILLILMSLVADISNEMILQRQFDSSIEEVLATPLPTLSESEMQDLFNQPVGEEGNE